MRIFHITVLICIIFIIETIIIDIHSYHKARNIFLENTRKLAYLAAKGSIDALRKGNMCAFKEILKAIKSETVNIEEFSLANASGVIIFSSNESIVGKTIKIIYPKITKDRDVLWIIPVRTTNYCIRCHPLWNIGTINSYFLVKVSSEEILEIRKYLQKKFIIILLSSLTMIVVSKVAETERKKRKKFEKLSYIDPLTELYNRRFILENIKSIPKKDKGTAVMMIDIDHFKKVNDTYGHQCGDLILKAIASCIKSSLRKEDLVVRYGGEEFLVIISDTDFSTSIKVGERILQNIRYMNINCERQKIRVTVSIGLVFAKSIEALPPLIKEADKMMYRAKKEGRNRLKYKKL